MDVIGTSTSMNLQYGVPLETLVNKFKNQRFEPAGYISEGHEDLIYGEAKSIVDYVFSFMGKTFLENSDEEKKVDDKEKELSKNNIKKIKTTNSNSNVESVGFCPACGAGLILEGHCKEICSENCGFLNNTGCAG